MRGYGRTDRPEAIDEYTLFHLVGDMVGLLDTLGTEQAVIAGHDWGAHFANPESLPSWLSEADVDFYADEFARAGFRGGLNWYRNIDRNWELLAAFAGARVTVPALYIAGDRDPVVKFPGMDRLNPNLANFVPQLRATIMLPGCGHWTQQERAAEVNAAMIDFLRDLRSP